MSVGGRLGSFEELQRRRLVEAWRADLPGSTTPHVTVALPSYSLDRNVYEHYGQRVAPLENRYLYVLLRACEPATRVVYLSSLSVDPEVVAGYLSLLEPAERQLVAERSLVVTPEDLSLRPLAEKLLDRGDLIDQIRRTAGDRPMLIEAWNVTEAEAALAVALGAPINGTSPALRHLATKSGGRRLLRRAGVPVPDGVEDVRTVADVARAIAAIRRARPDLRSVVVKLDDSVGGDGNIVVPVAALGSLADPGHATAELALTGLLPAWYRDALAAGGVVEERIEGRDFASPSAQASITPLADVTVLGTHEQRLGGPDGQVYQGSSFPADPGYARLLARHVAAVGRELARLGAVGRFAVDFVAVRQPTAGWAVHGLEINLRKGGTTHTLGIVRLLRGGGYLPEEGVHRSADGRTTAYGASDNLIDPRWVARQPSEVRARIAGAGLAFDRRSATGVVPHLLDCLRVDGRMGYTAIADDPPAVRDLEERLLEALVS